jgi:hypothetical protein
VEEWLRALHMVRVFGMPYRIVVAMIGVAVPRLQSPASGYGLAGASSRAGSGPADRDAVHDARPQAG